MAAVSLTDKLHPTRFPGMSPMMAAVVGYVLGESFTQPQIAEIKVSERENLVYIRQSEGFGFDGLQSLEDLRGNWNRLIEMAGLTPEERSEAVGRFNARVLAEDAAVMEQLANGAEAFRRRAARRVLATHGDDILINRCPACRRIVRTPRARQCFWCGHNWHGLPEMPGPPAIGSRHEERREAVPESAPDV